MLRLPRGRAPSGRDGAGDMSKELRDGLIILALAVAGLVVIFTIAWANGQDEEQDMIPIPPRGYEYCADEHTIGFCKIGESR